MTTHQQVTFLSDGARCAATHVVGSGTAFLGDRGRPCVVMAHGFGGTRDTGLDDYVEGFAAAGLDVFVFDYRGFGDSDGSPRQRVSYRDQRDDYRAAIAAARDISGVDPERIVLWGTSYSGGHVVPVAAHDPRVAAVLSLTPAMDGLAALGAIARRHPRMLLALVGHGLRDGFRAITRRRPHLMPIVGMPGTTSMISAAGAFEGYHELAGPTWRNEVCARAALAVAFNRPIRSASRLRVPMLVQIGETDAVAPPAAAHRAAQQADGFANVLTYPVDHFDVYQGVWQQQILADQIKFLSQHASTHRSRERLAR
ncbi:alpha/beta hydrolase [Aeromicrobium sp. A1-2]|uniref:alpha/beta hydrolase n=1 Tax=Aeromicrobium sp. A1-2 TaxID=2107713 RepID=UPI000E523A9C|nr:alpha/beta hydrolase [Aeromicrobium sp. A1-2]AXT84913.1 alpha/beta hydrolase [Aeromicrobium sp. A1-2]